MGFDLEQAMRRRITRKGLVRESKATLKPPTRVKRKARRLQVALRYQFRCGYCGAFVGMEDGTIDHIVPRSAGGGYQQRNLAWSCEPCNSRKGSEPLDAVPIPYAETVLAIWERKGRVTEDACDAVTAMGLPVGPVLVREAVRRATT